MSTKTEVEKLAYIFPGQGSQYIGMGKGIYDSHEVARQTFKRAEEVIGKPLMKWCFEGPEEVLNDTRATQPAVFTTSIAALRVLQETGESPQVLAGHSLGEYSALVAADALSFEDALLLVDKRAQYMAESGEEKPGAMAAISNLALDSLSRICRSTGAYIANQNTPAQNVISGTKEAISASVEYVRLNQGLRAVAHRLPISIAAHSPLMQGAADKMKSAIVGAKVHIPSIPVLSNSTAEPFIDEQSIRDSLPEQLVTGVLWWQTVENMLKMGVVEIKEVGPRNVLSKMIGRALTDKTVRIIPTNA